MKAILPGLFSLLLMTSASAQVTEGTVTYTQTQKIEIQLPPEMAAQMKDMPKEQKSEYEMLFSKNTSLFRPVVANNDVNLDNGSGVQIRMIRAGGNDKTYTDVDMKTRIDQRELGAKQYVVTDTLKKLTWKLTGETKTILGHECKKATSTREQERVEMNDDNGVMTRKVVKDTIDVEAWYATDIPSSLGPEYPGNLPGMILELSSDKGSSVYTATKIDLKYDKKALAPPKDGKKVTSQEFKKEQDAFFKKMEENRKSGGGPGWHSED